MSTSRTNTEKLYDVIKKPLITEKSYKAMQDGQYTFEVNMDATKVEIAQAVELAFPGRKVKKVRTVYCPSCIALYDFSVIIGFLITSYNFSVFVLDVLIIVTSQ